MLARALVSTIFLGPRVLEEWNPLTFQDIMRILMIRRDGLQIFVYLRWMSYVQMKARLLLDLEGLKRWLPGRTEGYALLANAIDRFGYVDQFVAATAARCG